MAASVSTWPRRLVAQPWLLVFVPINAATAGFGVVLPLLILIPLHGHWADVAIAALLYNVAIVAASVLWGHLSDRFARRRAFLFANYLSFGLLYLALTVVPSIPVLEGLYVLVGLVAPAGASASNLLILERFTERDRPRAYANFQEVSIVGSLVGLLLGYAWTVSGRSLEPLLYLLGSLALVSALWALVSVRDPPRTLTTLSVAHHPESLMSRLRGATERGLIPFFPHRPRWQADSFRRFWRWARQELRHELPLILAAGFLFNFASNLFNISYTPYLYAAGLGAASIFLVNFANTFAQGVVFPVSGGLSERIGPDRLVRHASYVRSLGYLAVALLTLVSFAGGLAFGVNLIVYAVLGGAIALYSTASSLLLFRSVAHRDPGRLLGVNSALGGVAAILGALAAGVLSFVGSYRLVFLIAAGALLASLPIWSAATEAYGRAHERPPAAPRRDEPNVGGPAPAGVADS